MKSDDRRLMWHGMFLFLLGLVTGLLEQRFTNMRMGLSAHLEGLMNGTFLVALGAIWSEVILPQPARATAFWGTLYATYGNCCSPRLLRCSVRRPRLQSQLPVIVEHPGKRVWSGPDS